MTNIFPSDSDRPEAAYSAETGFLRLLDLLCAAAQLFVEQEAVQYRWGQHISDDAGDNLRQYGVYGSAEAVLALAAGVERLGTECRYYRFLEGGRRWLEIFSQHPKKPIDLRKTIKVAELLSALAKANAPPEKLEHVIAILLNGRVNTGGWTFDLSNNSDSARTLPTLYACRSLACLLSRSRDHEPDFHATCDLCVAAVKSEMDTAKRTAYAYHLCYSIALFQTATDDIRYSSAIPELLASNKAELEDNYRFQYRIKELQDVESHAFCTLPTGLLRLWLEYWLLASGFTRQVDHEFVRKSMGRLLNWALNIRESPLRLLEFCSLAIRLFLSFEDLVNRTIGEKASATPTAPRTSAAREYDDAVHALHQVSDLTERQEFYLQCLRADGITDVKISQTLTGGYSGAFLDLCQTVSHGAASLPQVLKLDREVEIEREEAGALKAKEIIPTDYRVELIQKHLVPNSPLAFLRYQYAASDLRPMSVMPLLRFIERAADVREIAEAIRALFRSALKNTFSNATDQLVSLESIRQFFEEGRKQRFWTTAKEGFRQLEEAKVVLIPGNRPLRMFLEFPFEIVPNLFFDSDSQRRAWELSFPGKWAHLGHGDLNPRNILMVKRKSDAFFTPVLLDFHRFGGPLPLSIDFARLEAGLQIKGALPTVTSTSIGDARLPNLARYEALMHEAVSLSTHLKGSSVANLGGGLQKFVTIIGAVRECFLEQMPAAQESPQFYFGTLLMYYLNYLRPIYSAILTSDQRSFSLYLACRIFERHFLEAAEFQS